MSQPDIFAATPLLVRTTALLIGAGVIALALRRAAPATRHAIWIAALVGVIVLPIATAILPRWRVAMLAPVQTVTETERAPSTTSANRAGKIGMMSMTPTVDEQRTIQVEKSSGQIAQTLFLVWLAGAIGFLAWTAAGRRGLQLLLRRGEPVLDERVIGLLREERSKARVRRPVALVESGRIRMPLTWRVFRPVILLPRAAREWTDELRRAALRHELAHIARWDSLTQTLASMACAIYWFNPFVWLAARRARAEAERACDEVVIAHGLSPDEYAAHLLAVAQYARMAPTVGIPAIAMADRSQLGTRIHAILGGKRPSAHLSTGARFGLVGTSVVSVLALSAFQPVRRNVQEPQRFETRAGASFLEPTVVLADSVDQQFEPRATVMNGAQADTVIFLSIASNAEGILYLDLQGTSNVKVMGSDENSVRVTAHLSGVGSQSSRMSLESSGADVRLREWFSGGNIPRDLTNELFISVPKGFRITFAGRTTVEMVNSKSQERTPDVEGAQIAGYISYQVPDTAFKYTSQSSYVQARAILMRADSAAAALGESVSELKGTVSSGKIVFKADTARARVVPGRSLGSATYSADSNRLSGRVTFAEDSVRVVQGARSTDQSGFAYVQGTFSGRHVQVAA